MQSDNPFRGTSDIKKNGKSVRFSLAAILFFFENLVV